MPENIAIVDYGLGNLFSVRMACERVGMQATITSEARELLAADAIILPGVGAFGDAMAALERLDLVVPLRDAAARRKPMVGICLGMQLFMEESEEFGSHRGLGLVPGRARFLGTPREGHNALKVPHVGWNQVRRAAACHWEDTYLSGTADGTYAYFIHSYMVEPAKLETMVAVTRYGDVEFCSALQSGSVFGCQFHPERSGPAGLQIYKTLQARLQARVAQGAGR